MFRCCCESVCNFTYLKLANSCGPVVSTSDHGPRVRAQFSLGVAIVFLPTAVLCQIFKPAALKGLIRRSKQRLSLNFVIKLRVKLAN